MLGGTVGQLVDALENHQIGGFWNALQRYQFNGMDYIAGQNIRNQFHQELVNAEALNDRFDIANNILQWGNMRSMNQQMQNNLEASLILLNDEINGDLSHLFVGAYSVNIKDI